MPILEEFAGFFGYSKRTIIRALTVGGTSYRHIVEKHLFMRSLKLLEDQSLSVEEISGILGYSDTSNFIRAFKRWTATTPLKYRNQLVKL